MANVLTVYGIFAHICNGKEPEYINDLDDRKASINVLIPFSEGNEGDHVNEATKGASTATTSREMTSQNEGYPRYPITPIKLSHLLFSA